LRTYWQCLPTGDEDAATHPRVSAPALRSFAARILRAAGMEPEDARATAACLVLADLRGVGGHGVFRLLQYTDSIAAGEINLRPRVRVLKRSGATALVDADGGYGFRPTLLAMDEAVAIARRAGVGLVGVRNSHHFGMAAAFALRAASARKVGLVTTNSLPQIAAPGGAAAVVGNNPYAVAVPRAGRRHPIVVDVALTEAKFGTAGLAALAGEPLPAGLALDSAGRPTTDPAAALASGILTSIGGRKGYALSVAAEVLAAALTGSPIAKDSHCHRFARGGIGHLLLAVDPARLVSRRSFDAAVETLCLHVKQSGGETEVFLPGELGFRTYERRRSEGVPLPPALVLELRRLARELRVRQPVVAEPG
jgi:L-2-hydroxycarboxylate dehydrogenase (NAD+)